VPEVLEAGRRQLGVGLQRTGIDAVIGELEAAIPVMPVFYVVSALDA
jgi:hypothetical protein